MTPLLTITQVASWLDVSERTVARMVADGRLPRPLSIRKKPRFPADIILPQILRDGDVRFMGAATLSTDDGPISFEVIKARYKLTLFDEQWAVFEALDDTLHIRPWRTAFVFDLPEWMEHCPIILSCEDEDVAEFDPPNLHSPDRPIWSAPSGFFDLLPNDPKAMLMVLGGASAD